MMTTISIIVSLLVLGSTEFQNVLLPEIQLLPNNTPAWEVVDNAVGAFRDAPSLHIWRVYTTHQNEREELEFYYSPGRVRFNIVENGATIYSFSMKRDKDRVAIQERNFQTQQEYDYEMSWERYKARLNTRKNLKSFPGSPCRHGRFFYPWAEEADYLYVPKLWKWLWRCANVGTEEIKDLSGKSHKCQILKWQHDGSRGTTVRTFYIDEQTGRFVDWVIAKIHKGEIVAFERYQFIYLDWTHDENVFNLSKGD